MKFYAYRKWLNEKFSDQSDPIKDLGIGRPYLQNLWKEEIKRMGPISTTTFYNKNFRDKKKTDAEKTICVMLLYFTLKELTINANDNIAFKNAFEHTENAYSHEWENIKVIDMVEQVIKLLNSKYHTNISPNTSVNEKFKEESDPVHDMGIGIERIMDDYFRDKLYPLYFNDIRSRLRQSIVDNKIEFVKYLIPKVPNLNYNYGDYLETAVNYNNFEIVKMLVEAGANVNANPCILRNTTVYDNIPMLEYLINNGANTGIGYNRDLFLVAVNAGHKNVIQYLLDNIDIDKEILDAALTSACDRGDLKMIEFLVEKGAKVNSLLKMLLKKWSQQRRRIRVYDLLKKYELF